MSSQANPELHLLLDWQRDAFRPRFGRAVIASIAVHILLLLTASGLARIENRVSREPEPQPATHNVTPLYLPPSLLTQKAPNRAKVSKEVNLESLLSKPRPEEHPGPPRPVFRAPAPQPQARSAPPSIAAPPRIEIPQTAMALPQQGNPNINVPPPRSEPREKPKLAFEAPGAPTGSDKSGALAKLTPPKTSVQEAIRSVVRGGGAGGGITVGDIDEPPALSETMRQPPGALRSGSSLELLSDPKGVDFKPYLIRVLASVKRNWFAVMPESAHLGNRGRVLIQFAIARNGTVPKLVIVMPSGTEALDRAAVAGISASNPFQPLPSEFTGDQIRLQFSFQYNMPKN